jgi:uncharacterized membrane protein YoaK (UPF0700 family)
VLTRRVFRWPESTAPNAVAPSVDSSLGAKLLPGVLSVIAGSVDVICFLGLGGLFAAHITGNLVVLAAHIATGRATALAPILSVPVFIASLGLTRLLAVGLRETRHGTLRPLLGLQLALLVSFLAVLIAAGSGLDPAAPIAVVAGMLGVAAMAVQNALVQISMGGAPATAVMTTDITKFMMDIVVMLFRRDSSEVAHARSRASHTWPAIVGFTIGCGLGAVLEAAIGYWSLALPTGLGLLALALGFTIKRGLPAQRALGSLRLDSLTSRTNHHREPRESFRETPAIDRRRWHID